MTMNYAASCVSKRPPKITWCSLEVHCHTRLVRRNPTVPFSGLYGVYPEIWVLLYLGLTSPLHHLDPLGPTLPLCRQRYHCTHNGIISILSESCWIHHSSRWSASNRWSSICSLRFSSPRKKPMIQTELLRFTCDARCHCFNWGDLTRLIDLVRLWECDHVYDRRWRLHEELDFSSEEWSDWRVIRMKSEPSTRVSERTVLSPLTWLNTLHPIFLNRFYGGSAIVDAVETVALVSNLFSSFQQPSSGQPPSTIFQGVQQGKSSYLQTF